MNELRKKIQIQYMRGVQYGELRAKWGNDPKYVADPCEYAAETIDAILDAVIASLPEPSRPFNIATQLIDEKEGEENYRYRAISTLQAAKEPTP